MYYDNNIEKIHQNDNDTEYQEFRY